MNTTLTIAACLQEDIVRTCRAESFAVVNRRQLDEAFPHPEKLSLAEIDDMITLALVGNIPPPPEEPTQAEKIASFCEDHGLILRDNGWEKFVTFLAKGMPAVMKDRTKQKLEDCAIGEMVHESSVPAHARGGRFAQCLPKRSAPRYDDLRETMRIEISVTPMTFERERLHNGECVYKRVS